ncbi:MAG: class I SAM-dependent methyltransferase [Flavobacteriaceae bacterium]|nr:class I SAM-dependent methyltransferase [Flavobacteriaceae bacterium]
MTYFLYLLIAVLAIYSLYFFIKRKKHRPIPQYLPAHYNFGKRQASFIATLDLLDSRSSKTLIETGTARKGLANVKGDGAGTILFGIWAKQNNATLHSVDIDGQAVAASRAAVKAEKLDDVVSVHEMDSLKFLAEFKDPVDFLYLDSYDYDEKDPVVQQKSQEHHLLEFKAIEDQLHDKSVVLIDDCGLKGGGKGKTVIAYMQSKGWRIFLEAYQVLLVKA